MPRLLRNWRKSASSLLTLFSAVTWVVTGCSLFNPYDSEFTCEGSSEKGKCASIQEHYEDSRTENAATTESKTTEAEESSAKADEKQETVPANWSPQNLYKDQLYYHLALTLRSDEKPSLSEPFVLKVYVLPYEIQTRPLPSTQETYPAPIKAYQQESWLYILIDEPHWTRTN